MRASMHRSAFLATALVAALLPYGCGRENAPLLEVGDWTLPQQRYVELAWSHFGGPEMAASEPLAGHERYLEDILVRQLKVVDGRNKGLANHPEVIKDREKAVLHTALNLLVEREVVDEMIPEEDLRDYYRRDTQEVNASHILIRAGRDSAASREALDRIREVRAELMSEGISFQDAASRYSDDTSAPDGHIGWFDRGVMVKAFEETAFELEPGRISEPVRTEFGWHLIQVHERRRKKDRPSFEEARDRIKRVLATRMNEELEQAVTAYVEELKQARGYTVHMDTLDMVAGAMEGRTSSPDPFGLLNERQQQWALASFEDGTRVRVADLRETIATMARRGRRPTTAFELKDILDRQVVEMEILPHRARELELFEAPTVQKAGRDAADARIYQLVQQQALRKRIEPTEEQARAHYMEHGEKYQREAQSTLVEVLVSDRELAEEIARRAREGENLRELSVRHSERTTAKERNGTLGPVRRSQYGPIGRMSATAEIGEIIGPVRYQDKWTVFRVIAREEPRLEDFEKVEKRVRTDLRMELEEQREQAYVDSLRAAIDHTARPHLLKGLFE